MSLLFLPNNARNRNLAFMAIDAFMREEYRNGVLSNDFEYKQVSKIKVGVEATNSVTDASSLLLIHTMAEGSLPISVEFMPAGIIRRIEGTSTPKLLGIGLAPDSLIAA